MGGPRGPDGGSPWVALLFFQRYFLRHGVVPDACGRTHQLFSWRAMSRLDIWGADTHPLGSDLRRGAAHARTRAALLAEQQSPLLPNVLSVEVDEK